MAITTYINGCEHSSAEILEHLNAVYDSAPHYVTFRDDALASPEEVASSQVQLNLMHRCLTAAKLRQECIDLAEAEKAGTLEWIDFQPFIHLSKDSPLLHCFDSLHQCPRGHSYHYTIYLTNALHLKKVQLMQNLTSTKFGTFIYYIINTFADGVHRIASSFPRAFLYLLLALLLFHKLRLFHEIRFSPYCRIIFFSTFFLLSCWFSCFLTCGEFLLFTAFQLLVFITHVAHVRG